MVLLGWARNWLRREQAVGIDAEVIPRVDPLLDAARRLRTAREARGLSLRQLAQTTRVSTAVLESLEKGWGERLPEPTYLRPILTLLERRLDLERGSLQIALPPRSGHPLDPRQDRSARSLLVPTIELLGSWQGGLVYGLLCLALVYGLNRQQQHLAGLGLLTLRPIPALLPQGSAKADLTAQNHRLLRAYPDLQPLERARRGQALAILRRQSQLPARARAAAAATPARPASQVVGGGDPRSEDGSTTLGTDATGGVRGPATSPATAADPPGPPGAARGNAGLDQPPPAPLPRP
ncbi:MAG: helix-turn-helix transcriptional regulator [Synechococcus sp.]|nr:helix-turn-helix transcriptional regulator [Synechococcus sp.]